MGGGEDATADDEAFAAVESSPPEATPHRGPAPAPAGCSSHAPSTTEEIRPSSPEDAGISSSRSVTEARGNPRTVAPPIAERRACEAREKGRDAVERAPALDEKTTTRAPDPESPAAGARRVRLDAENICGRPIQSSHGEPRRCEPAGERGRDDPRLAPRRAPRRARERGGGSAPPAATQSCFFWTIARPRSQQGPCCSPLPAGIVHASDRLRTPNTAGFRGTPGRLALKIWKARLVLSHQGPRVKGCFTASGVRLLARRFAAPASRGASSSLCGARSRV